MTDIDEHIEVVRQGLPPRGMTTIPVKRVRAVDANRYHASLDILAMYAKMGEPKTDDDLWIDWYDSPRKKEGS
jgi:hypothetical protein